MRPFSFFLGLLFLFVAACSSDGPKTPDIAPNIEGPIENATRFFSPQPSDAKIAVAHNQISILQVDGSIVGTETNRKVRGRNVVFVPAGFHCIGLVQDYDLINQRLVSINLEKPPVSFCFDAKAGKSYEFTAPVLKDYLSFGVKKNGAFG